MFEMALKARRYQTVGRIAAFFTYPSNPDTGDEPSGGIGFFDCIQESGRS